MSIEVTCNCDVCGVVRRTDTGRLPEGFVALNMIELSMDPNTPNKLRNQFYVCGDCGKKPLGLRSISIVEEVRDALEGWPPRAPAAVAELTGAGT